MLLYTISLKIRFVDNLLFSLRPLNRKTAPTRFALLWLARFRKLFYQKCIHQMRRGS